jgi:hypothetical protein
LLRAEPASTQPVLALDGDPDVENTADIASYPPSRRAHWTRRIRGDQPGETIMTIQLTRLTLGAAHALTRDGFGGLYTEVHANDSRQPIG